MNLFPLYATAVGLNGAVVLAAVLIGASVRVMLLLHQGRGMWRGWRR